MRVVVALAVIVALVFVARGVDGAAFVRAIAGVPPWIVLLVVALHLVNVGWKSLYWRVMVAPVARVPLASMFRTTIVSMATSALVPARAGDLLRVMLLHRERGVPLAYGGSIAAFEKAGDVLALLMVVAPIPWLVPGAPAWVLKSMRFVIVLAIVVLAILAIASLSSRVRKWLKFPAIERPTRLAFFAMGAIAMSWATDLVEVMLVLGAVGLPATVGAAALVLLAINLAIAVPVAPGHAGTLELGAIAALDVLGAAHDRAVAFALVYHLLQLAPTIAIGLWLARGQLDGQITEASRPRETESSRRGDR
jgi:uncharacterized membrane protein YbhN (UPF0104 family)